MKGGEFLIADQAVAEVFTPEDFTDEHRMISETCREYIDNEVAPNLPALEGHDWEIARGLLKKAGDLGLLGANIPESLGGMDLDQTTGAIIAEMVGRGSGFGSTYGAQTSIGLLPILYWGSEELKKEWIPGIISGETVSAYCLTESSSGSRCKMRREVDRRRPTLCSQRREDVDNQRRFCRCVSGLCKGRWREGKILVFPRAAFG